jgi:hypothetical protein
MRISKMTPAEREVYLARLAERHKSSLTRGDGIKEPELEPKVRPKRPRQKS